MKARFATLGEVAEFINGAAFKPSDWGDIGKKIIRIQNLTDSSKPYNKTTRSVNKKFTVNYGDILVSWSATLGVFVWTEKDEAVLNQHIFKVIHNSKIIDKNYLRHCMHQALDVMTKHLHGATMKHVNRGEFLATEIPLPPLEEQQRIAALLDTADRILKQRESAITKLDKLAQSLFFQIDQTASKHFKLSDISKIVSGATPKTEIKEYWNGNIHWATPAELGKLNDIFINQTARRITNKGLASCTATLLPTHSVLFSSRAPIGHIAINSVPMATNQGFKSFVVDKQLVQPLYLYYWFNQNKLLLQRMGVGATFKELSKNIISEVKIKLPSINDQNKFVNQVNNIRDLKIKNLRAIKEIRNLISSLQHQSFTVN